MPTIRSVRKSFDSWCKANNPGLLSEWHPTKNLPDAPSTVGIGSKKKYWWIGKCGHEWDTIITVRIRGNGCPVCAGRKVLRDYNDLAFVNPTLAEEWDTVLNEKTPYEVTTHSGYRAHWRCKICGHSWVAPVYNRSAGSGCPICSSRRKGNHRKQIT